MSALVISRPRLLQITSVAVKGHTNIQPFASDAKVRKDRRSVLPTDPGVKPFSAIPGPPSLPILGDLLQYVLGDYRLDRPYETYSGFFRSYGPLVKENLFLGKKLVHVFDPKDLREVYRNEQTDFPTRLSHHAIKKHREANKDIYGHIGVAPSNGHEWNDYRSLFGQFSRSFEGHAKGFEKIGDDLIEYIESNLDHNKEIDLLPTLYYYTLECMGALALGIRMGCFDRNRRQDVERFIQAVHDTHYAIHITELNPYILARKAYKDLYLAQDYIADFVLKHMSNIKGQLELASIKNIDPFDETKRDEDLVIQEDESNPIRPSRSLIYKKLKDGLSDRMILPMAADFFQGGIHSTALTLTFALYHLALNQDKQEILRKRILEGETAYQRCVINETLRINPAAIGTGRVLNMDLVLSGYHVPKGTNVILHQEIAAKNEKNFPEPLRFIPERMAALKGDEQNYSFKPFIEGSKRMCIGFNIAHKELNIALTKIIKKFRITYYYDRVGVDNYLLNQPDRPIRMRFEEIPEEIPDNQLEHASTTENELANKPVKSLKPTVIVGNESQNQ